MIKNSSKYSSWYQEFKKKKNSMNMIKSLILFFQIIILINLYMIIYFTIRKIEQRTKLTIAKDVNNLFAKNYSWIRKKNFHFDSWIFPKKKKKKIQNKKVQFVVSLHCFNGLETAKQKMVTLLCHSCNVTQRNSCKTNRSNKKKKHTKVFTIFILIFQKYNVKIRIDDVSRCYFFHQWGKCMKLNNFEHFLTNNHGIRQMYIIKRMERVFK